ncbi:MAG: glycoside hydrolase family 3 N-terminal domain-containing protein [Bacteroidota bacterium]
MKYSVCAVLIGLMIGCSPKKTDVAPSDETNAKVEELLAKMTLEEKAGQLHLAVGDLFNTGPTITTTESGKYDEQIREGRLTGLFNIYGAEYLGKLQKIAVEESRLGIPLLFGADVIHGFRTVFPIPLAEVASWDMQAIENGARVAAIESTATGITFNFAPMVDISRDARWGRVAEGAGEDPFLGAMVAAARVRGFQGDDLSAGNTMAACLKHFAAYGAPHGGREYNTVDMSERLLRDIYLPPFKSAIDAGAATVMSAFNELNGIPATGNQFLLDQVLRQEMGFKGMVVSDWNSVLEIANHGMAADRAEAGMKALMAGTDMDMMSYSFLEDIPRLVKEGKLDESYVDRAVRRVLQLKFDLGLFDNPYQYCDPEREKAEIRSKEHLDAAQDMAKRSIVLLKNENNILPLKENAGTIALIGPLADNKADMNGTWSFFGNPEEPISMLEGIKQRVGNKSNVIYAKGCNLFDDSKEHFAEAIAAARRADVVVLAVGEGAVMNGEAASRVNIGLPGIQPELVKAIHATGKPIVVLLSSGRPMVIPWLKENVQGILATWTLGSQSGPAIAEVLFGDYNPGGKLPMTFPRHVGQVPIYYNYKLTGRPYEGDYAEPRSQRVYKSRYRDVEHTPLYPFGYGLSYTTFEYGEVQLSSATIPMSGTLKVSAEVTNTGSLVGEEVVQLYVQDLVGSVTRPVKELKGFQKLSFEPGETKKVAFELTAEDLSFHRFDMTFGAEPGKFKVFIGTNSRDVKEADFELTE